MKADVGSMGEGSGRVREGSERGLGTRAVAVAKRVARRGRASLRRRRLSPLIAPSNVSLDPRSVRERVLSTPRVSSSTGWPGPVAAGDWDLQTELLTPAGSGTPSEGTDIRIAFGRNGRPLLVSGAGALDAAATTGRASVEASVVARHEQWARFLMDVRDYLATGTKDGRSYQLMDHPDLAAVPAAHTDKRLTMIMGALPPPPANVLDIGANWGHFVIGLCRAGYRCTGVEVRPETAHFAKGFVEAAQVDGRIIEGSIFDCDVTGYDVVLALSIFHHFLKSEENTERLEDLLSRMNASTMVFQPHTPDYFDGRPPRWNPTPEEFSEWVAEKAGLRVERVIGTEADGRPLYLLTR